MHTYLFQEMKKYLITLFALIFVCESYSQNTCELKKVNFSTPTTISIHLNVYSKDKKHIEHTACVYALKMLLFDGINKTLYSKPLIDEGEQQSMINHPEYFNKLYSTTWKDFIRSLTMLTKFRKGENKYTEFNIEIRASLLRKDLEKNKIRTKIAY